MVGAVPGDIDPRNFGADLGVRLRDEVTEVIRRDGVPEEASVGDMSDRDEDAFAFHFRGFPGLGVFDADTPAFAIVAGQDLFRGAIPEWLDLLILQRAVGHDLGCTEFIPAVDEGDLGAKPGQEKGFLAGRIAPANDNDIHIPVESSVASCTGSDTLASEHLLFAGDAEKAGGRSCRNDDRLGLVSFVCRLEDFDITGKIHAFNPVTCKSGTETFCLAADLVHECVAVHPFREAREIFDLGGRRQLPAGLGALQDEWVQVGACSVDGGGESGAAGSEDDDVFHIVCIDVGGFLGN